MRRFKANVFDCILKSKYNDNVVLYGIVGSYKVNPI